MSDAGTGAAIGSVGGPVGAGIGALIGSFFGSPDPSSFTQTNPGASTSPGNIAYQGILPSQNSSTQFIRSLQNSQAQTGQQQANTGTGDVTTATGSLQKVIDYYGKLLSGNQGEISTAIQPQEDAITGQFNSIRNMLAQGGARGGGTASALATMPQQESAQIGNLISQAVTGAAPGMQGAAGALANIGVNEQQLGAGNLDTALSSELQKEGIDVTQSGQNKQVATSMVSALV